MSVVVVGVDGSETAGRAAVTAAHLSVALGADLLVISAFPASTAARAEGERDDELTTREVAEQFARQAADAVRGAVPGARVSADAEPGRPADALISAAQSAGADLIVIGNRRVHGVSRILGSVAVDVVRKAPCDVYIAHTHD